MWKELQSEKCDTVKKFMQMAKGGEPEIIQPKLVEDDIQTDEEEKEKVVVAPKKKKEKKKKVLVVQDEDD